MVGTGRRGRSTRTITAECTTAPGGGLPGSRPLRRSGWQDRATCGVRCQCLCRRSKREPVSATQRKRLTANLFADDAVTWTPPPNLDAILLDAPCTATGTIRRHPDLPWRKCAESADALLPGQDRLLKAAAAHLGPGGILVYTVCSLDPREGEVPVLRLLDSRPDLHRMPANATEIGGLADAVTASGDIRTLPSHLEYLGGMDGFYIARLRREP